ncbi:hypothetical protein Aco03nite_036130 [Actinoplanes couchii]|uniref:Uncharacterized protein n=1 Tax=Actinoplanes couchii TaxID=403638 RepID=A0ABQ3X9M0_9ACTN|nr:hypothetical protein Aco03nite_036130 [Actinoplanes couchii]
MDTPPAAARGAVTSLKDQAPAPLRRTFLEAFMQVSLTFPEKIYSGDTRNFGGTGLHLVCRSRPTAQLAQSLSWRRRTRYRSNA